MSGPAEIAPPNPLPPAPRAASWSARWDRGLVRVDRVMSRAGEWLNPILVKETRQALKSQQFVITFALLLGCGWIWSLLGLGLAGDEAEFGFQGRFLFNGYFLILAFPLLVIVPFSAFRSLAVEQEDRTYELLSISTLSPRQIISGKLGSVALQMCVYLSAISPCVAFTYLLRGIALPTILLMLAYLVLASLGLSLVGLLFGSLTGEKHWQVVLSVLVVVGLVIAFWIACMMVLEAGIELDQTMNTVEFWIINAAMLTAFAAYFALGFFAAVAQITFATDNRSTAIRVIIVAQYAAFVSWMAFGVLYPGNEIQGPQWFLGFLSFAAVHWWIMGAFMTGELPYLSLRVRRSLPQSVLGRVFLTWATPGPGTGYLLAVAGMFSAAVLAAAGAQCLSELPGDFATPWTVDRVLQVSAFGGALCSYLVIYLGLGLLVIRLFSRRGHCGMFVGLFIHLLMAFAGNMAPWMLQLGLYGNDEGYTLLQLPGFFWTMVHLSEDTSLPLEAPMVLAILALAALVVLWLNMRFGIAEEVSRVRIPKPQRVAEEDALLHPAPPPLPASPWD